MSKAKLKKYLQTLSKEQVIEVMIELYDARKEIKEYLEFYLAPDSNAELEKCKKLSDKSSSLPVVSRKSPHSQSAGKSFPISKN